MKINSRTIVRPLLIKEICKMDIEKISIKLPKQLLTRIENYASSNLINRSEAIRNLVEIGLKISELKDEKDENVDLKDDIMKMNIDMWLILAQLYRLFDNDKENIEDLKQEFSKKYREIFSKKFKAISENYEDYLKNKE